MSDRESAQAHDAEPALVVACTANGEVEAETIRSALEAAGIPAELRIEAAQRLFAVTVDGLGGVRVMVPADLLEEARAILENPASTIDFEPFGDDEE